MRFGELRHRVALQAPTTTREAGGGFVPVFATDATVWASINTVSGREELGLQQTQNVARVRIVIRHHATIKDSWRVVDTGSSPEVIYTIHYIERGNKIKEMLTLWCSEGVQTA